MKINHPFKTAIHPDLEGFLSVCEKYEKMAKKRNASKKVVGTPDKPEIMPPQKPLAKK